MSEWEHSGDSDSTSYDDQSITEKYRLGRGIVVWSLNQRSGRERIGPEVLCKTVVLLDEESDTGSRGLGVFERSGGSWGEILYILFLSWSLGRSGIGGIVFLCPDRSKVV
jgi:hypothetical protein